MKKINNEDNIFQGMFTRQQCTKNGNVFSLRLLRTDDNIYPGKQLKTLYSAIRPVDGDVTL